MILPEGSPELGVEYIALVESPAIKVNWQAFDEIKPIKFTANEEKRIISGPLLIPNLPIYRRNDEFGEHYVVTDAATIQQIAIRFFKNHNTSNVNEMHDSSRKVEHVTMFESFFLNKERGINTPAGNDELPDGTWWSSYKVDNEDVWVMVKDGTFKGFSIEGDFGFVYQKTEDEMLVDAIIEAMT